MVFHMKYLALYSPQMTKNFENVLDVLLFCRLLFFFKMNLFEKNPDNFERHTIHAPFTRTSVNLYNDASIFSLYCFFDNYNTLYVAHSIPLTCFHVIEL